MSEHVWFSVLRVCRSDGDIDVVEQCSGRCGLVRHVHTYGRAERQFTTERWFLRGTEVPVGSEHLHVQRRPIKARRVFSQR